MISRRELIVGGGSLAWAQLLPPSMLLSQAPRRLKVLILGGTSFLGPAIVENALDRGHEVTLFNRGKTNPDLFPEIEKIRGDRDVKAPNLVGLQGSRSWDAVIDVWPSDPHMVAATARLLRERIGRYVFVSSIVAYKDLTKVGATEADPLFDDLTDASAWYEYDKAQCERVLEVVFGARHSVCRSHIINGYRNPSDSFRMWLARIVSGGSVLAPGTGEDPVQFIDVKDVAAFTVAMVERDLAGAFNVAGPALSRVSFRQFLERLNEFGGNKAEIVWVSEEFLRRNGVRPFSDLAMWVPLRTARKPGFMQVDISKATHAGMALRALERTAEDELRWFRETMAADYDFGVGTSNKGFPRARERELLKAWRQENGDPGA